MLHVLTNDAKFAKVTEIVKRLVTHLTEVQGDRIHVLHVPWLDGKEFVVG